MVPQHRRAAEPRGLLGKLCPGEKKLEGKTFYVDNVKKGLATLLLEAISLLGGRVESFLHKDVSFVVTGSREGLKEHSHDISKEGIKKKEETCHPVKHQDSVLSNEKLKRTTPSPRPCGSRGKALLEKAIRKNEWLHANSVLANAQSWGVKILYVDDVLLYLKQLNRDCLSAKGKKNERVCAKQQRCHVVKALRSPYLKVEDSSKKYRPLHMQSMNFPTLCYSGQYSPFEAPSPRFEKKTEQVQSKARKSVVGNSSKDRCQTPLNLNPSPWKPPKRELSFCECCNQPFLNLEEHLHSEHHRAFVTDPSNYSDVDQLIAAMIPEFDPNPSQPSESLSLPPTALPFQDFCELEPLPDAETDLAVRALQTPGSFCDPAPGLVSFGPASQTVEDPIPNLSTLPADAHLHNPNSKCSQPHSSTPAVASFAEQQTPISIGPDLQKLIACPNTQFPSLEPSSLPPVLVPYHLVEAHSSYSDPPVLSPQKYIPEEDVNGECETIILENASKAIRSISVLKDTVLSNGEVVRKLKKEALLRLCDVLCPSSDLVNAASMLSPHGSHQPVTAFGTKKRRMSTPELKYSKKSRMAGSDNHDFQTRQESKLESDVSESCVLSNETSCQTDLCSNLNSHSTRTCTEENLALRYQTAFCVPTVPRSSKEPSPIDLLGQRRTQVVDWPSESLSSEAKALHPLPPFARDQAHRVVSCLDSQHSQSLSTSVCIESALIPDIEKLAPSSSESDWDCDLLSRLGRPPAPPLSPNEQNHDLDQEMLLQPCTWMHDTNYESHLHTVLQVSKPATSLCGDERDPSAFSRTMVQIVEVQY